MRLMTFVLGDFLPHLHCMLSGLFAGCCGSHWKAFRLVKTPLRPGSKATQTNGAVLIDSLSADFYAALSSCLMIVETK